MPPRSRVLNGFELHYQKFYVLSEMAYNCIKGRGYDLTCPVCNVPMATGDEIAYLKKQFNPDKIIFHRKCYETLPRLPNKSRIEIQRKYRLKHPKPKKPKQPKQPKIKKIKIPKEPREPKPKAPRPPKIKSNVTVNKYYCNHCRKNVHGKVYRDKWNPNRIIELYCEVCGEGLMRQY